MKTRLATSAIALTAAFANPVLADVTAADVWSNQQSLYDAMGMTLGGELSGNQIVNPAINVTLPEGIANMQIKTDAILVTENSDGSVVISYPSPMNVQLSGTAEGEGSFSLEVVVSHDGYTITATGEQGDVSYATDAQNLRFEFDNVELETSDPVEFGAKGFATISAINSTARITEGNVISYESSSQIGNSEGSYTVTADNVISQNTQTSGAMESSVSMTLPVGGSDIMNLSQAFRNGLSVSGESSGDGSTSSSITTLDGETINRQNTTAGAQTARFGLDESGLTMSMVASDIEAVINEQMLFPGDIEFGIETASADYVVPLNASEEAQSFRMATSLQGIVLGDMLWNMMDPSGQLVRDPAEVSFDVTGSGTNGMDLLDIAAISQLYGAPPIEIDDVTIENLRISALGAEATAQGAFTFDWSDFQTIPGIARPEGEVTVNLNGVNQLLDTLTAMGIIAEDEVMMPRMMMGMFATPVGDDMLESVIEVNDQGHVLANGQRLQ